MLGTCIVPTLCSLTLLTALAGTQPRHALRNVRIGEQVPAFSAVDLDGGAVSKAVYEGKVLLLVFVRPDQEKSIKVLRAAQQILQDYGDTKLAVLAVYSSPQATEHFKRLASERGFTYSLALDPARKMYGDFGLLVSPTTLLVDGAGTLRLGVAHTPPNYEPRLRLHIDQLLGRISPQERDDLLARMSEGRSESTDSTDRRLGLARALIDHGQFDQAVITLTQLKRETDSPLAAALLATAYLRLDKVDEAAKCLAPLAEQEPAVPELKLALARLELRRQNDDKAEAHLTAALQASPENGEILFELGRLYERQGKLARAIECYRKALEEVYSNHH